MPGSSAGAASQRNQPTELPTPASSAPATAEARFVEPNRYSGAQTTCDTEPPAAAAETGFVEHHSHPGAFNGGHAGEAAAALEPHCLKGHSPSGKSTRGERVEAVAAAGMRQAADADCAEARPAAARAAKLPPSYDSSDDEDVPAPGRPGPFSSSLQARGGTSGFASAAGQVMLSCAAGAENMRPSCTSWRGHGTRFHGYQACNLR